MGISPRWWSPAGNRAIGRCMTLSSTAQKPALTGRAWVPGSFTVFYNGVLVQDHVPVERRHDRRRVQRDRAQGSAGASRPR